MVARLPRVAVVIGSGAATVREILMYGEELIEPVLIFDDDPVLAELREALKDDVECLDYRPDNRADLLTRHRESPLEAIVTFAEDKIRVTAEMAALLALPYHSPRCARLLTDKGAQREALGRAGLGIDYGVAADAGEAADLVTKIGVECVIKPLSGSGSRHTYALTPADAAAPPNISPQAFPAIVETRLATGRHPKSDQLADVVSIETVFSGGRPVHIGASGRFKLAEPFRETGMIFPAHLPSADLAAACETATRALGALGVNSGTTHTELKLTPSGPQIIEVNGRLGGDVGRLSELSTGTHAVELVLRSLCGLPVEAPAATAAAGVWMIVPPVEAVRLESRVPAGELRAIEGVVGVDVHTRPGEAVDYRTGWWAHVACVWYRGEDWTALSMAHMSAQELVRSAVRWGRGPRTVESERQP